MLRLGKLTDSVKETLIRTSQNDTRTNGQIPTQLFTHRNDVVLVNTQQLHKLTTKSYVYCAQDTDDKYASMLDSLCPTPRKLELKVGAQVMLNKNIDVSRGLVNGLTGTILSFDRPSGTLITKTVYPRIKFVNGIETLIEPEKWIVKISSDSQPLCRKHLPLQLAWALSVHKSQGMTISNGVELSLAKVFECGQAYVALSRATNLDNVKIINFNSNNIVVNNDALNFYQRLKYV